MQYGKACDNMYQCKDLLKGFAYEVDHLTLKKEISRGVSNEIKDDLAFVSCKGRLLIMETMD